MTNNILNSLKNSSILSNLLSQYIIRLASMFIPLIMLPLLTRRLNKEAVGVILYAQYTSIFLGMIIDFGFPYTATRLISRSRENLSDLSRNILKIQRAKLILVFLYILAVIGLFSVSKNFHRDPIIIFGFAIQTIFFQLSPIWYFQGIENVKIYASIDLIGRVVMLIMTYLFVTSSNGAVTFAIISALSALIPFGLTNRIMYRNYLKSRLPFSESLLFLKESLPIFMMRIGSGFYMAYTPVFLGNTLSPNAVATYGGAERIFRATAALLTPITDAIFPRINSLEEKGDHASYVRWQRISLIVLLLVSILGSTILYFGAELFVNILLGSDYVGAVKLIHILIIAIPAIAIGSYAGVQVLLAKKQDKWYAGSVIAGGFFNVILLLILVPHLKETGAAIAVVSTEWLVCLLCLGSAYITVFRRRINDS